MFTLHVSALLTAQVINTDNYEKSNKNDENKKWGVLKRFMDLLNKMHYVPNKLY
jgi:hypothetical protein